VTEVNELRAKQLQQSKPSGWGPAFQLFDSPETRRADVRVKSVALLLAVLIAAYCCQLLTLLVLRFGGPGVALGLVAVALTGQIGPPRWPLALGVVRVAVGLLLGSPLLTSTAAMLWVVEAACQFFSRRLYAAGHGGRVVTAREFRRQRVQGLREIRSRRLEAVRRQFGQGRFRG
jgi:hypothetical protein